jgi:hypothetical protein
MRADIQARHVLASWRAREAPANDMLELAENLAFIYTIH